jgi:hypothetical protein
MVNQRICQGIISEGEVIACLPHFRFTLPFTVHIGPLCVYPLINTIIIIVVVVVVIGFQENKVSVFLIPSELCLIMFR